MNIRTNSVKPPEISISQLEQVFATFNKVSSDLGSSYKELEERVAGLSKELAVTHSARLKELTEKEKLASKLSALMAALPGGIIVLDARGKLTESNPTSIQILDQNFIGRNWSQVLESVGVSEYILNGEISFENGKRISIISSSYGTEGEKIILLTDISESYHLNILVNREKRLSAMGEMAARLAHQVRTPLSSAILYLSHLTIPSTQEYRSNEVVGKIHERLRQIEKLVEGMLSYIRGGINDNEEFSLNILLNDIKEASKLQINAEHGQLILRYPRHGCFIKGNRESLFNAISNLIDNSIQAVATRPIININLSEENGNYIITQTDNGPGIDDSIKEKVFDPFFTTRPMGTGLGLAVVLSAVKAHNGEILIKNADDGGSVFQLIIPGNDHIPLKKPSLWKNNKSQVFSTQTDRK